MPRFRKKPVEVEAVRNDGTWPPIMDWLDDLPAVRPSRRRAFHRERIVSGEPLRGLDAPCARCERPAGDHTLREWSVCIDHHDEQGAVCMNKHDTDCLRRRADHPMLCTCGLTDADAERRCFCEIGDPATATIRPEFCPEHGYHPLPVRQAAALSERAQS